MKHRSEKRSLDAIATAVAQGTAAERNTALPTSKETDDRPGFRLRAARYFNVSDKRSARAIAVRRSSPIHAYVGPNGGGKSACMVRDTLPSLKAGRRVVSTVTLIDPRTGHSWPNYERFTDWDQLLEARDCDVLMDEMVGIASSRESMRLDQRVQNVLVQLRRRNVVLRWSAPNWARADKIVREVTQAVTECRGSYPDRRLVRAGEQDAVQLWAPKRLFVFRTYDTTDFEEWSAGKREKADPITREWVYGPGSEMFAAYNTLDAVSMVSGITPEGRCDVCGGKKTVPTCKGHADQDEGVTPRRGTRTALQLASNL